MKVRKARRSDRSEWARMRNTLWQSCKDKHLQEIDLYFSSNATEIVEVLVLERDDGNLGGFIELNIRNYAEGSKLAKIPYVEGWYIDRDLRNRGYGKKLMAMAERWAIKNGFSELASDTELENSDSIAVHQALGFQEVDRIVCFLKKFSEHQLD